MDAKDPLTKYRVDKLEDKLQEVESLLQELLLELRSAKKAGKWVFAIAAGFGSLVTWIVQTLGIHMGD